MPPTSHRVRLFRLLLRLYPRAYRERYGTEMEAFFREERRAGGGGPAFWGRVVGDHLAAAWAVRRGGEEGRMGASRGWRDDGTSAWRSLRRSPGFALFAVATLALGVGSTAAVFTVVERVVLRPLPYPDSERMVRIGIDPRHDPGSMGPLSPALLHGMRATPGPMEALVAARSAGAVLEGPRDPERIRVTSISPGFLRFFGAVPQEGRLFDEADHHPGADRALILGHGVWLERWGGDPGVVGRALRVDGALRTVVGVLGPGFVPPPELTEGPDFWVPLTSDPEERGSFFLAGVGRLRPGATVSELDAHLDAVVERVYEAEGGRMPVFLAGGAVRSYRDEVVGPVSATLGRVLVAAGLLLVIACMNVAGLLLTRGSERRRELALRAALGASRRRLLRAMLAESVFLALAGGGAGAGLAWGAVELFRRWAPPTLPRAGEVALDGVGLGFALVAASAAVLLFGVLPAFRATRGLGDALQAPRRGTASPKEGRLRGGLVALETALAVVLAVGSGLLAHDLVRVATEDPGFRPEGLVAVTLDLEPRYGPEEWASTWTRLLAEAQAVPGVGAVAVATQAPYDGSRVAGTFRPEGWSGTGGPEGDRVFAVTVAVGGAYLEALGTEVVEGRALGPADGVGASVAVVNRAFADRYWPGESAVGKQVASGEEDEPVYRVVGVLEDVHVRPGQAASPHLFLPLASSPWREMEILARARSGDAGALATGLREAVRRVDPGLPVTRVRTVEALASRAMSGSRFYATLFGGFAAVALLLAVVGVYGTTAFVTRTRLRDAGIRLALGATRRRVVGGLVARAGMAVGVGVALGLVGAGVGARVLAGTLRAVAPGDPATYGAVAVVVGAAGLAAAWLPAARAGRVDPAATLRQEGP